MISRISMLGMCLLFALSAVASPASGPQQRATVQRPELLSAPAFRLVDSKGQVIGTVIANNTVAGFFDGVLFQLSVTKSGFPGDSSHTFYYITSDCSGQAYGRPGSGDDLFTPNLVIGNSLYYLPDAPRVYTFSRRAFDQSGPHACESLGFLGAVGFVPYASIPLNFAPPFHVIQ